MKISCCPGQSIITLSHLYKRESEVSLRNLLARQSSDKKRIAYLAEATAELTGLDLFPQYLTLLFEVDALFLNDDRHLNNIAVLECDGKYDYCPIFDNGAGLLSNTRTAPMDIEPKALIAAQRAVRSARPLTGRREQSGRCTVSRCICSSCQERISLQG